MVSIYISMEQARLPNVMLFQIEYLPIMHWDMLGKLNQHGVIVGGIVTCHPSNLDYIALESLVWSQFFNTNLKDRNWNKSLSFQNSCKNQTGS
jgi:hypothetical protein